MIRLTPYYASLIFISSASLLCSICHAAPRTLADLEEQTPVITIPKSTRPQTPNITKAIDAQVAKQMLEMANDATKPAEINSYLDVATKIKLQNMASPPPDALLNERAAFYDKRIAKVPAAQVSDDMYYEAASIHDNLGNTKQSINYLNALLATHPQSKYAPESRFRLAELYFHNKQYRKAITYYQQVVNTPGNKLGNQARYLLAWAYLKDGQYEKALDQFSLLNSIIKEQASIGKADQQLLDDSYEAVAVIYAETGGESALNNYYAKRPLADDEAQIYSLVANKFLAQKQAFDAGKVYEDFITRRPMAPQTLDFSRKQIAVYETAGLASDIIRAKEVFITNFDETSPYYKQTTLQNQADVRITLTDYTRTLAKHYHAVAQKTNNPQSYVRPAQLYEKLIALLPKGTEQVQTTELLAATLYESHQYDKAIPYFEALAYELPSQAPEDSAYFGLLSIQALKQTTNANEQNALFERKKAAGIKFARTFPKSDNAYPVLAALAAQTLNSQDLMTTAALAQDMIDLPRITPDQLKTSLILLANSQFDLKQWANAEQNYRQILKLPLAEPDRARYQNQLSASLYQQARDLAVAGNTQAAVSYYQQSSQIAADPELKINAAYQSISAQGNEPSAIPAWLDFYRQYPQHELSSDILERVLAIQERDSVKDWNGASNTYQLIYERDAQHDRSNALAALWRAADILNHTQPAITDPLKRILSTRQISLFQNYLAQPDIMLAQRIEATKRLFISAQNSNDPPARQAQYNAYKTLYNQYASSANPDQLTDLREMASLAQVHDNEPILQAYQSLTITLPLRDSIARKAKALEQVVQSQKILLDLKSANFVTQAQYTLGKSYVDFYNAIANAPIPPELDELAAEEYKLQIEEQTQSFKDKALQWHALNAQLAIQAADKDFWDNWIGLSFDSLAQMSPGRYSRPLTTPQSAEFDSELLELAQKMKASSQSIFADADQYSEASARLTQMITARQAGFAKQFPAKSNKVLSPDMQTIRGALIEGIANAYWFKGLITLKQGRFNEALSTFKQAEISYPLHKESIMAQAVIQELYQGKLSDALANYERYMLLDSTDKSVQKWINVAQKTLGIPLTNFKPVAQAVPESEINNDVSSNISESVATEAPLGEDTAIPTDNAAQDNIVQPAVAPTANEPPSTPATTPATSSSAETSAISSEPDTRIVTSPENSDTISQTTTQDPNTVPATPNFQTPPTEAHLGQEIPLSISPESTTTPNVPAPTPNASGITP